MLEVRNLTKIYKPKNGADVKALDGVSLQFPQTGMVFLLGKSGSGKSTLLNVCGGLDSPTSGEIIVKGRSSKNFSQSDFDSYRNTYVGFVFQEYNILNEFSVEDNIALALELQGKPKDKKAVAELLNQVDLEGYGKRKPNTLSGGQKQRIAIARALVKSPEIIMADEPTGALDSLTGKQVFETLKKLSKDKLVLIVSHDREFAEQYGDRIIELKDGQVISDVTKTQEKQQQISENIHSVGDVLCIKKGTDLSQTDFEAIKGFLKKSSGDIIIANNEKDVNAFKKVSRITEHGEKEVFRDTLTEEASKKNYRPEDSKFIRSKLPGKHAVRMGISSLKNKPIRLFFTIVLCTAAFVLFGLLSTMNFYDSEATFRQTLTDSQQEMFLLEKSYQAKEITYENGKEVSERNIDMKGYFSPNDIESMKSQFGQNVFGGVSVDMGYTIRPSNSPYWLNQINMMAYLPEDNEMRSRIQGEYPVDDEEICISSYMADVLVNCKGYDDNGDVIDVASHQELIHKKLVIYGEVYTITGIIDSGSLAEKYEVLKSEDANNNTMLINQLQQELCDGIHLTLFVNEERLEMAAEEAKYINNYASSRETRISVAAKNTDNEYEFPAWSNAVYENLESLSAGEEIVYVGEQKSELSDGEVLVSTYILQDILYDRLYDKYYNAYAVNDYVEGNRWLRIMDLCSEVSSGGAWSEDGTKFTMFPKEELIQKTSQLIDEVQKQDIPLVIGAKLFDRSADMTYGELKEFTVSGVILPVSNYANTKVIVSDSVREQWWNEQKTTIDYYYEVSTEYVEEENAIYSTLFLPYDRSEAQIQALWELYNNDYEDDFSRMDFASSVVNALEHVDNILGDMAKVFLYVGLILAVFAALLLSNFISTSITQKRREIGILRAVGARGTDVFKIFFSESFVIATICVLLASVISSAICSFLNSQMAANESASIFVFGAMSMAVLVAIAIVTTVIATFIPVWNAARKKPIESIRTV